jgi:hypothetical protein
VQVAVMQVALALCSVAAVDTATIVLASATSQSPRRVLQAVHVACTIVDRSMTISETASDSLSLPILAPLWLCYTTIAGAAEDI